MRVFTAIEADKPTEKGSVYKLELLEKLVVSYNSFIEDNAVCGGWLTDKMMIGEERVKPFFAVTSVGLENKKLYVDIEFFPQKAYQDTIKPINEAIESGSELLATLIIQLPLSETLGKGEVEKIIGIHSVALSWKTSGPKVIID